MLQRRHRAEQHTAVGNGGEPPGQRRSGDAGMGLVGQEQGQGFRGRRQRGPRMSGAPGAKNLEVASVGGKT